MTQPEKQPQPPKTPLAPFQVQVESGELAARDALRQFLDKLSPLNLDVEESGTIELVLAEILNNIMEHAYPESSDGGPIDISCIQKPDGLHVEIRDHGEEMPERKLPLGRLKSLDVDVSDLPEGGFGWFLIRHLAKDVTYGRDGAENLLSLRLAIGCIR